MNLNKQKVKIMMNIAMALGLLLLWLPGVWITIRYGFNCIEPIEKGLFYHMLQVITGVLTLLPVLFLLEKMSIFLVDL